VILARLSPTRAYEEETRVTIAFAKMENTARAISTPISVWPKLVNFLLDRPASIE